MIIKRYYLYKGGLIVAKRQLKTLAAVLLTLTMVFASFIPTFAVETNDTYVVVGTENVSLIMFIKILQAVI